MEAFFTMEGVLVVAVCTKKDYMAVALPEYPLADSCWVSVNTYNTVTVGPCQYLLPFSTNENKRDFRRTCRCVSCYNFF